MLEEEIGADGRSNQKPIEFKVVVGSVHKNKSRVIIKTGGVAIKDRLTQFYSSRNRKRVVFGKKK